MEKEKEAAAFYRTLAKQARCSGSQTALRRLCQGGTPEHLTLLQTFGKEKVADYPIQKIPNLRRSDFLVDLIYEPGMNYADILRLAMKREEKAMAFYSGFAGQTPYPDHQKLFQVLAQEEAKHKLKLETLLDDYLAKLGD